MTTQTRNMPGPTKEEYAFIGHLTRLLEQPDRSQARAAMAHLRRGLGKPAGTAYEMDRYILTWLPEATIQHREEPYYWVASLFASWHQGKDKAQTLEGKWDTDRNLGKSLSRLAQEYARDGAGLEDARKRLEKSLNALLNSHRDDLPHHLRRVTALLRSKEVPVNWAQLLHDLHFWDADGRYVQHAWARGFWTQDKSE
jgi:CRISPR system Cascade subunit CasB